MTFNLDTPASPELFNAATDAGLDFAAGLITEDAYLAILALYQRAERERFERVAAAALALAPEDPVRPMRRPVPAGLSSSRRPISYTVVGPSYAAVGESDGREMRHTPSKKNEKMN